MTTISLNFLNRVKLTGILNSARGGDGGYEKLHALLKVFEAARFSEDDLKEVTVTDLGNGVAHYQIKDPANADLFAKDASIEDQQAKWLLRELDAWLANATIEDLQWFEPMKAQLTAKKPEPKMQFKRRNNK